MIWFLEGTMNGSGIDIYLHNDLIFSIYTTLRPFAQFVPCH
jgi:hypothetical protein